MAGRNKWTRAVTLAATVVPLVLLMSACNVWDMYGFDSTHSGGGQSGESVINASKTSLSEAGSSAPISGSVIRSEPTSDGDLVFSTENVYVPPPACNNNGCHQGTLTAYRADGTDGQKCSSNSGLTSCTPEWQVVPSNNEGLNTSPAYYDDTADGVSMVFVGDNAGRLWAYNAANGTLLWHSDLLSGEINGSITIDPGGGPTCPGSSGPDAQIVVTIVYGWTFFFPMTNGTDSCSQIPAPGAGTKTGDNCEMQSGIQTCFPQWGVAPGGDDESTPAIANSTMYTTSAAPGGSYLYAYADSYQPPPLTNWCGINADGQKEIQYIGPGVKDSNGKPLLASCSPEWRSLFYNADGSSPAVSTKVSNPYAGMVYLGTQGSSGTGYLMAYDAQGVDSNGVDSPYCTGEEWFGETCNWAWRAPTQSRGAGASPTVLPPNPSDPNDLDGIVYLGDLSGELQAFNATTGDWLWSSPTGGIIDSDAAIADAVDPNSGLSSNAAVYVGCSNAQEVDGQTCTANLFGFNAETGAQLWMGNVSETNVTIDNGPIIIDNEPTNNEAALYVGASWGNLTNNDGEECFNPQSPAQCTSGVFAFTPSS